MLFHFMKSRPLIKPRQFAEGPREGHFSGPVAAPSLPTDEFTRCISRGPLFLGHNERALCLMSLEELKGKEAQ